MFLREPGRDEAETDVRDSLAMSFPKRHSVNSVAFALFENFRSLVESDITLPDIMFRLNSLFAPAPNNSKWLQPYLITTK